MRTENPPAYLTTIALAPPSAAPKSTPSLQAGYTLTTRLRGGYAASWILHEEPAGTMAGARALKRRLANVHMPAKKEGAWSRERLEGTGCG
jgi:hypothetical protein